MRTSRKLTSAALALCALVLMSSAALAQSNTLGPGLPYPATSEVSDQKAGSVLVYNFYTSGAASGNAQNTRINITNTNPTQAVAVHLFFVAENCNIADAFICLTRNQTASFLASDIDPGVSGFVVAVASDDFTGCPSNFNFLIGDEYVKLSSGHSANLGAEAFAAVAAVPAGCGGDSVTAELVFNGTQYNRVPQVLAASSIPSRQDGNDTIIVLNRIGGNLATGTSTLGNITGIFFDDAENALSFNVNSGNCQYRTSLTDSVPRLTPRFTTFVPAGRSGWAKFYSLTANTGLLGAQMNYNANAGTAANAFSGGHNLHKLTLAAAVTLTLPIFPGNCDFD